VAVALKNAEVGAPWAYGVAVLVSHGSRDLVEVSEVMNCPCSEKLRERHWAEGWMASTPIEIRWLKIQFAQLVEISFSKVGKFVEQVIERLTLTCACLPVERFECLVFAELQDCCCAGDPVCLFTVNEVPYNVECAPGAGTFIA
jgi:hypothetical protein